MDKITKAFVIGACSVVIATPVVWLGLQIHQGNQRKITEKIYQQQQHEAEITAERESRKIACNYKMDEFERLVNGRPFPDRKNSLIACVEFNGDAREWMNSMLD